MGTRFGMEAVRLRQKLLAVWLPWLVVGLGLAFLVYLAVKERAWQFTVFMLSLVYDWVYLRRAVRTTRERLDSHLQAARTLVSAYQREAATWTREQVVVEYAALGATDAMMRAYVPVLWAAGGVMLGSAGAYLVGAISSTTRSPGSGFWLAVALPVLLITGWYYAAQHIPNEPWLKPFQAYRDVLGAILATPASAPVAQSDAESPDVPGAGAPPVSGGSDQ